MSHVSFRLRGAPNGYVRVWGPSADPSKRGTSYICIERYNGALAFRHEGLARRLEAKPRAQERIESDPLGWSAGPGGGFDWGLSPAEIAKRFDDADALVRAIVDAFAQEGVPW